MQTTYYAVVIRNAATEFNNLESAIRYWDSLPKHDNNDKIEYRTIDENGIWWAHGDIVIVMGKKIYVNPNLSHN